jgi:hypothetical protein
LILSKIWATHFKCPIPICFAMLSSLRKNLVQNKWLKLLNESWVKFSKQQITKQQKKDNTEFQWTPKCALKRNNKVETS